MLQWENALSAKFSPTKWNFARHNIQYHFHADDTQLSLSFDPCDAQSAMARLNSCLVDIRAWVADNFLKLNDDKTELLLPGNPKRVAEIHNFQLIIGDNAVKPSACVRSLGVYFDSTLSFKTFINKTAASAMYHNRTLAAIRDHLPRELTSRLCTSLVISPLDCCNSVLSGVPKCSLGPLQLALNMAARVVFKARRSCHVSPSLD